MPRVAAGLWWLRSRSSETELLFRFFFALEAPALSPTFSLLPRSLVGYRHYAFHMHPCSFPDEVDGSRESASRLFDRKLGLDTALSLACSAGERRESPAR